MAMNEKQRKALEDLCRRYRYPFDPNNYKPTYDLPKGYVAGWVKNLYVGVSPKGEISS